MSSLCGPRFALFLICVGNFGNKALNMDSSYAAPNLVPCAEVTPVGASPQAAFPRIQLHT